MADGPWTEHQPEDEGAGPWSDYQDPRRRSPKEMSSLQAFGRGAGLTARGAIEGTASMFSGLPDIGLRKIPLVQKAFGPVGGAEPAIKKGLDTLGLPDKPENTFERIAKGGGEYGPAAYGGAVALGPRIGVALKDIGRSLMSKALKPTASAFKSGDAEVAIDTMLEKGLNVTKGGVDKLKAEISNLNDQVEKAIASSTATVDKAQVGKRLNDLLTKFKNQVNPQADVASIRKAWDEFKNHPAWQGLQEMGVQAAHEIKKGTQSILRKKYGQMGSAEEEAQKTLARGLREEVAAKEPAAAAKLAEEAKLIKTLNVAERQAWIEMRKNPGGLALLTHNPGAFAAFMMDKSSAFKSLVARALYSGSAPLSTIGGEAAGAAAYEAQRQRREE